MKKITIYIAIIIMLTFNYACKQQIESEPKSVEKKDQSVSQSAALFLNLPEIFNSPASGTLDKNGNMYFTSPNFHNDVLIKSGNMNTPAAPTIGKVNSYNELSTWYTFTSEDFEKTTGKVAPFGIAFGPDGNAYVADMQLWFNGQSRILRINVKEGKAISVDVVLIGTSFPNALVWKGNDLFISDTVLSETEDGKHVSGVYKVNLSELNAENPLKIAPYKNDTIKDSHLFETFISNGKLKFGANGLAIDDKGNLYTGIMEEGTVLKTLMDEHNNKIKTIPFAKGMIATDGMKWDSRTQKLYITDIFANAVYSINTDGKLNLLAKNGDTNGINGELDAPSEVVVRGKDVIVMNFDATFESPEMINTKVDKPYTLSIIEIE